MMLWRLVVSGIRRKPLGWAFHILSLALGVAVVIALLTISRGLDTRFDRDLGGIDLVVGAKGSPLQIILSSVFQVDQPTGNIPIDVLHRLQRNMLVKEAVPISLGDNIGGYRIVGTSTQFADIYNAHLAQGRWWNQTLEAVLGSEVADREHLKVGMIFVGEHGLMPGGEKHFHSPYRVVGILAPTGTVVDRLALTDVSSVWKVHEHENAEHAAAVAAETHVEGEPDLYPAVGNQVTSVLVRYRSVMGALMIPRMVKTMPDVQSAVPALELARLQQLLGTGGRVLRAFGIGLLMLSAIGFFVALLSAVQERQRDLALLRALGGGPSLLMRLVLTEALLLGFVGSALGVVLGRVAAIVCARAVSAGGGPLPALPAVGRTDLIILCIGVLLALVAAMAPALAAYRIRPAKVLRA